MVPPRVVRYTALWGSSVSLLLLGDSTEEILGAPDLAAFKAEKTEQHLPIMTERALLSKACP